jgi:hypothetical protein
MGVCGANHCDFVVWSHTKLHVKRVPANKEFIKAAMFRATEIFREGVLPELLWRWFSRSALYSSQFFRQSSNTSPLLNSAAEQEGEKGRMVLCRQ